MRCPRCAMELEAVRVEHGLLYRCTRCGGCSASMAVLRKRLTAQAANTIWRAARAGDGPAASPAACPACARPMAPILLGEGDVLTTLDGCARCQVVWFDDRELARVPARPPPEAPPALTPPQAEAHVQMQMAAALQRGAFGEPDSDVSATPLSARARLVGWVGHTPWLSLVLALILLVVQLHRFVGAARGASGAWEVVYREQVEASAFDGTDPLRLGGRTLVTSFFTDGSDRAWRWRSRVRLEVGCVVLLLAAGYLLERRLGRLQLAGLLAAGHAAALLAHMLAGLPREAGLIGAWPALASAFGWAAVVLGRAYLNARRLKSPWWERWHAVPAIQGAFVALLFAIWFLFVSITTFLVPWEDVAAGASVRGLGRTPGPFAGALTGLILGLLTLGRVRRAGNR